MLPLPWVSRSGSRERGYSTVHVTPPVSDAPTGTGGLLRVYSSQLFKWKGKSSHRSLMAARDNATTGRQPLMRSCSSAPRPLLHSYSCLTLHNAQACSPPCAVAGSAGASLGRGPGHPKYPRGPDPNVSVAVVVAVSLSITTALLIPFTLVSPRPSLPQKVVEFLAGTRHAVKARGGLLDRPLQFYDYLSAKGLLLLG